MKRLEKERDRLLLDAAVAAEKERAGEKSKESAESLLNRKAVELDMRLRKRLELLKQALMSEATADSYGGTCAPSRHAG